MIIGVEYSDMSSYAIHGLGHENAEHAHLLPIFSSSTFTFDSAQQGMDRFSGKEPGRSSGPMAQARSLEWAR